MKLALMALVIEICLARLIAGSWGWAAAIVVLYCTFVYVRQTWLAKRRDNDRSGMKSKDTVRGFIEGNIKREKELYGMYTTFGTMQKN